MKWCLSVGWLCVCVCLGSCYICKWQSIWPSGSERTYNLPRPGQQCIHLPRRGTGSHCGWNTSHNWRNVPESFTGLYSTVQYNTVCLIRHSLSVGHTMNENYFTGLYSTVQYSTVQCVSLDTHCLVGTRWMRIISQVCTVQYSTVCLIRYSLSGGHTMNENYFTGQLELLIWRYTEVACLRGWWLDLYVMKSVCWNSATSAFRLSDLHIY